MARLPFHAEHLLSMGSAYSQTRRAIQMLTAEVAKTRPADAVGLAILLVEQWQARFEDLLRSEIPDWACLAAFRSITDFNITDPKKVDALRDAVLGQPSSDTVAKLLRTWADVKKAYEEYFGGRDLHSGKFTVLDQPEADLLKLLSSFRPTLGGQAGNILWLLASINANARGYVPYLSSRTADVPEIQDIPFLGLDSVGGLWMPLSGHIHGVVSTAQSARVPAPSGGSFVIAQHGKRMILELKGFRVIQAEPESLAFDEAEYQIDGVPLTPRLRGPESKPGDQAVWPMVPFFARVFIEGRRLVIDILGDDRLRASLRPPGGGLEIQQAVIGGLNAVFYNDPWLNQSLGLRRRLAELVEQQMRCLRSCGIRIGAELSGRPDAGYARMLEQLCREGTIVGLGINGEDELPEITDVTVREQDGQRVETPPLGPSYYLNPAEVPPELRSALQDKSAASFPYVTYLRSRKLAAALGIRTLYIHTNSIDMVLRRHADPGSLLQAQRAAFMGKGLVIAALMKRSYPGSWESKLPDMPLAVNPEAMVKLWHFAGQFDRYQAAGSFETLLTTGMWINPSDDDYSLALLPVLWPSLEDRKKMPPELNTTGAGDMTFGVFFYLGGV